MASKFRCPGHYDKPRKARNVKPLDFTFLRVLSSLGREIWMPSLHFLFLIDYQRSLFKSITRPDNVAASFLLISRLTIVDCALPLNTLKRRCFNIFLYRLFISCKKAVKNLFCTQIKFFCAIFLRILNPETAYKVFKGNKK